MNENENKNLFEETEETVAEETTEVVEEVAEEVVEEATEDAYEEAGEEAEEAVEEAYEMEEAVAEVNPLEAKLKKVKTSAIIAWVLVAILALFDFGYYYTQIYNKYNHMGYLDINGMTIGDVAASSGMSFEEFKEQYGLPADMKKSTNMNAAQNLIPVKKMLEMYNSDLETLRDRYHFSEEITEDNTWGQALESMALRDYVGEDYFEEFKTEYALGEEITLDTKWGEIREIVEKKQYEDRIAAEKGIEEEPVEAETETEEESEASEEEAPEAETLGEEEPADEAQAE